MNNDLFGPIIKRQLIHGDCLDVMKHIPDGSVDMVLTDPPYGTTACKWDSVIPFEPMWAQLKRITKKNGAIVLFGAEPFSSFLRVSNIKDYKYDWVWEKSQATGFLNAWRMPLKATENISVFYKKPPNYSPILTDKELKNIRPITASTKLSDCYGARDLNVHKCPPDKSMPKTILKFNNAQGNTHPTQKPVALMEYLIRTYTNEGETVLDFTMGSGTTGVACKNLNRSFIGIEMDAEYFRLASERIESHQ